MPPSAVKVTELKGTWDRNRFPKFIFKPQRVRVSSPLYLVTLFSFTGEGSNRRSPGQAPTTVPNRVVCITRAIMVES